MRSISARRISASLAIAALAGLAQSAHGSYNSAVLADSPTGFWPLNETSGTTAANVVNAANGMTYADAGATQYVLGRKAFPGAGPSVLLQPGAPGPLTPSATANINAGAYWTTGGSTVTNASPVEPYDYSANFTIESWVNWQQLPGDPLPTDREIFGGRYYGLTVDPDGTLHFVTYGRKDFNGYTAISKVQPNTWQDVAVTFQLTATNTVATYYINGVLAGQDATGTTAQLAIALGDASYTADSSFAMGQRIRNNQDTWLGGLEDLSIYDSVLTPQQLLNHYLASQTPVASVWSPTSGTSWNQGANWTPVGVPNAQGAVVNFTSVGAGSVTLDANQTVGTMTITSATPYTISANGAFALSLDDTASAVPNPSINVVLGNHTISAPISMAAGLNVNFSNASGLTVSNAISGTGPMTVNGAGTLTVATTGSLNAGSSLALTTGSQVSLAAVAAPSMPHIQTVAALAIDPTSRLDIGNNEMIVSTATPAAIQALIVPGYNSGLWTGTHGIISSTAQTDTHHGVGYISNGTGGVEMRYTLYGDTNLDGTVNFGDLLTLAQNYNSTTATWATGDFNYDNTVNFSDLLALAQNYNGVLSPGEGGLSPSFIADWNLAQSEVAAVPEPASIGLLAIGAIGLAGRRRRH